MSKKTILYIIFLIALELYSFKMIKETIYIAADSLVFLYLFFQLNKKEAKRKKTVLGAPAPTFVIPKNFDRVLKFFVFGVVLSFIPAMIFHDQPLVYSYGVSRGFFYVMLYFYFHKKQFRLKMLEDISIYTSVLFQMVYWFELKFLKNNPIFGTEWTEAKTTVSRIMIDGRHLFMLSFYILLVRFTGKTKPIFVALFSISFLTVILLQTRQLLLPACLVLVFHFRTRIIKSFIPSMFLIGVLGVGAYFSSDLIDKLINKSVTQSQSAEVIGDRQQSYIYYLTTPSTNWATRIFGEGFPAPDTNYGQQFFTWRQNTGMSPGDIGPVGWVFYYGYIWLICLIIMVYRGFKIKVPEKLVYTKYYMFTVLLTLPMGEAQFVQTSSLLALMITFYVIDVGNFELKFIDYERRELRRQQKAEQDRLMLEEV